MSIREALEEAIDNMENSAAENEQVDPLPAEETADYSDEDAEIEKLEAEYNAEFKEDNAETIEDSNKNLAESAADVIEKELEIDETPRPTTWKKEYLPLWDKARKGEAMSADEGRKLTDYLNQREQEYKKGVSTYKAEADRARVLEDAITPFVPELQAQGIHPAAWINNLGHAHMVLTKAPYQERVEMFNKLAKEYGIQFNQSNQVQQLDPYAQQLMQQLQQNEREVQQIKSRFQQEEDSRLQAEIGQFSNDGEKYPHFEALREDMAQLLELGKAQDIPTAYKLAVRLNDDVWQQEQDKLLSNAKQEAFKQAQVQKAKSAAVSVKSTTPSGITSDNVDKKDRSAVLRSAFDTIATSRV